ncbi:MAG: translation initiation factor IF-3 [Candidatus Onthovivens sp.]|nr:translation initiation factor IF-3 [Candidatus Onthovivens sp.]
MQNSKNQNRPKNDKFSGDLVNEKIHFKEVLVIGPDGESLGKMSRFNALNKAEEYELDLLCVAPNANPPVCKIINYGKYRFESQKKAKEAKKNQKIIEIKEIQLTPTIGEHDIQTKVKAAIRFLNDGNKIKVGVRFRGRQLSHVEVGEEVLNKFIDYVKEYSVIEKAPSLDGKWLTCVLASKIKK